MDDRDPKLERLLAVFFVSALLWAGFIFGVRIMVAISGCQADRELAR